MDTIKDFEISYSDDIIFLQETREAYLSHHLIDATIAKFLFDPYCCRMLSILIVGNIEMLAKAWYERVGIEELNDLRKDGGNRNKINGLKRIMDSCGLSWEDHILELYIAIKSLRNAIIHSDLDIHKKRILVKNSLPIDIQKLDEITWDKFLEVNSKMMLYLNQIGIYNENFSGNTKKIICNQSSPMVLFEELDSLKIHGENNYMLYRLMTNNIPQKAGDYITKVSLGNLLWKNMINIKEHMGKKKKDEINYISFAKEVLTNWKLYIVAVDEEYNNISVDDLSSSINVIKIHVKHKNSNYMDDDIKSELIAKLMKSITLMNKMNLFVKDYEMVSLFLQLLENVHSDIKKTLVNETLKLILASKLKRYYDSVERNYPLDEKFMKECDELINNLGENEFTRS